MTYFAYLWYMVTPKCDEARAEAILILESRPWKTVGFATLLCGGNDRLRNGCQRRGTLCSTPRIIFARYWHFASRSATVRGYIDQLGTTYSRQYDYQQAQPYYEQALKIGQEENDQMIVMMNTSNLGGVQRGFGKHKVSTDLYQHSLEMARELGKALDCGQSKTVSPSLIWQFSLIQLYGSCLARGIGNGAGQ